MLLFTVENTFFISGRGLMLVSSQNDHSLKTGDKIELVTPAKSRMLTAVIGVSFDKTSILIDSQYTKKDIPIGTEVWLA